MHQHQVTGSVRCDHKKITKIKIFFISYSHFFPHTCTVNFCLMNIYEAFDIDIWVVWTRLILHFILFMKRSQKNMVLDSIMRESFVGFLSFGTTFHRVTFSSFLVKTSHYRNSRAKPVIKCRGPYYCNVISRCLLCNNRYIIQIGRARGAEMMVVSNNRPTNVSVYLQKICGMTVKQEHWVQYIHKNSVLLMSLLLLL